MEGWKLYKWSLRIKKKDDTTESFSVPKWISTQLLSIVDNSGVRRFVVEPSGREDGETDGLLVCSLLSLNTDEMLTQPNSAVAFHRLPIFLIILHVLCQKGSDSCHEDLVETRRRRA